jgi:hypothetical protein
LAASDVGAVETLQQEIDATLAPTLQRIAGFAALEPDWDSYGGKPTAPEAIRATASVVQLVVSAFEPFVGEKATPFWVSPLPNGGVQIEWRSEKADLEIEVGPRGDLGYLFRAGHGSGATYEENDNASLEDVFLRLHAVVASWLSGRSVVELEPQDELYRRLHANAVNSDSTSCSVSQEKAIRDDLGFEGLSAHLEAPQHRSSTVHQRLLLKETIRNRNVAEHVP